MVSVAPEALTSLAASVTAAGVPVASVEGAPSPVPFVAVTRMV